MTPPPEPIKPSLAERIEALADEEREMLEDVRARGLVILGKEMRLRAIASELGEIAGKMRAESSGSIGYMDDWADRLAGKEGA